MKIAHAVALSLLLIQSTIAAPPNIIFILADDLGYGDISCYNPSSKIPTPHLDTLAANGMQFMDAHSAATSCKPSRLSLMTGRHSFRFPRVGGCLIEEGRLTLPQMLKNQGYTTAAVGKWHVGLTFYKKETANKGKKGPLDGVRNIDFSRPIPDGPVNRGFDTFFGTACCPTTDYLYSYIVNDKIPNPPTKESPKDHKGRLGMQSDDFDFDEVDMKFLEKSKKFLTNHAKSSPNTPFFLYHCMQAVHLPSLPSKDFKGKSQAGPHGDFLLEMDHIVGELMKTLKELDLYDNTLVIFSSDNGPETSTVSLMKRKYKHNGTHPWRGFKRESWEGGHRMPLIAHWPNHIKAASQSHQTISLVDIMATCASIVNVKLPNNAAEDSFDFKDVLLGNDDGSVVREYTMQASNQGLSIRQGKWKYIENHEEKNTKGKRNKSSSQEDNPLGSKGQLYNLEADPGETTNLYSKQPERVKHLSEKIIEIRAAGRSTPQR